MRRLVVTVIALAGITLPTAGMARSAGTPLGRSSAPGRRVEGELLVIGRGGTLTTAADGGVHAKEARLATILSRHGLGRGHSLGNVRGNASSDWFELTSSRPDFDPVAAARELNASGTVVAAAANLLLSLYPTIPNDPLMPYEYWVTDPGNADIQLAEAWDVAQGDTSVAIGVMDTGVDRTHPDLATQIWRNWGEIPGNGIDDDLDGYIDDVNGWDFGNHDNDPNPEAVFDEATGIDIGFHGTFVAGLASAATNNGVGIAGAGWRCRILPLKVADASGAITLGATTEAFRYAWNHHISVLNMSLGTADTTARPFFQALVDTARAAGVLCVASAGNDGLDEKTFPASCNGVLSVGATDDANQRASFSNYGTWVDVAAPGSTTYSTICQNYVVDDFSQIFYIYLFGWDGETPYMYGDGTSFSSPVVSGVCAMLRAQRSALTPDQITQVVIATGDPLVFDHPIGPKLNAFQALTAPALAVPKSGTDPFAVVSPNPFHTSASIRFVLSESGAARVSVYDVRGRLVSTVLSGTLAPGEHEARWDGLLPSGEPAPAGVYFARIEAPGTRRTLRLARLD